MHRTVLRALTDSQGATVVPGAPDAISARLIASIGFEALYISGAGLANAGLGVPDFGLVTATELGDQLERVRDAVELPIIVDADTGFGGPFNVRRTIQTLERRGASAIQIEDQVFPKRCGHFDGKQVIPVNEMVARLAAALDARRDDDLLIIARTDARAPLGLDAAIERAHVYREAGADILFVEAPESVTEIERIGKELDGPLMLNIVEGGKTPQLTREDIGRFGYQFALYANTAMRAALHGMRTVLGTLMDEGTSEGVLHKMIDWDDRQLMVDKPFFDMLDERYRGVQEGVT